MNDRADSAAKTAARKAWLEGEEHAAEQVAKFNNQVDALRVLSQILAAQTFPKVGGLARAVGKRLLAAARRTRHHFAWQADLRLWVLAPF